MLNLGGSGLFIEMIAAIFGVEIFRGAALQFFNIGVGIAIYSLFIRILDK